MKYSPDRFEKAGSVVLIPSSIIRSNPDQPRKSFRKTDIDALCVSIRQIGIIQPLLVRFTENRDYELISGERRLIAAKKCGLSTVPCLILNPDRRECLIYSLTENLQRKSLDYFDEAQGYRNLQRNFGFSERDIAIRIGKSTSSVCKKLRILQLSPEIRKMITENSLSAGHAAALLKVNDNNLHKQIISYVIENKLNVTETENYIDILLSPVAKFRKLKDITIFINTINHAVDTMRKAGINAVSDETEMDDCLEFVVRIPKMTSSPVNSCDAV